MTDIVMPRLTDSMEEGTVLSWLKQDGDEVAIGDELVEIETDKASMVYESDAAGILKITVSEGKTLPIGETIATVGEAGESSAESEDEAAGSDDETAAKDDGAGSPADGSAEPEATQPESGQTEAVEAEPAKPDRAAAEETPARTGSGTAGGERLRASPLARRIASDRGVELRGLDGSGPAGRIIKVDVEKAAAQARPEAAAAAAGPAESGRGELTVVELSRTQQTIAKRMADSMATAPHFYLRTEVEMDRAFEVRAAHKANAGDGVVPSLNDLVVKATARALRNYPRANGSYRDGHFELYSRINIGIAVATEGALIVPVVTDADRKSLSEVAATSRYLAEQVRSGQITPPELSDGTFTISNLGMFGIRGFDAVINSGQAGILAVGEAVERPVYREGELQPARLMEMSLACDHRILYGADGALFLADIKAGLEEPGLLI